MSIEDMFWEQVDKASDGCWLWNGKRRANGYGIFGLCGYPYGAHRFAYFLINGNIPKGHIICHKCDNPPCVRPDHLYCGTHKDNSKDAWDRGRRIPVSVSHPESVPSGDNHWTRKHPEKVARGENHYRKKQPSLGTKGEQVGGSKLTTERVLEMRQLHGLGWSSKKLAAHFQVSKAQVWNIVARKQWTHI